MMFANIIILAIGLEWGKLEALENKCNSWFFVGHDYSFEFDLAMIKQCLFYLFEVSIKDCSKKKVGDHEKSLWSMSEERMWGLCEECVYDMIVCLRDHKTSTRELL